MSFNVKEIVREPALLLDTVETGLVLLVALGLSISGDQQNYIVALIIAVIGVAKAWATEPFPVTLITDLSRAVFVLAATFGVSFLTPDKTAILVTFIGTFVTLLQRAQISPSTSLVATRSGSGAGPVYGASDAGLVGKTDTSNREAGYMDPMYMIFCLVILIILVVVLLRVL